MKVLREVITTVPGTRRALLRIPLQFLSFGSAQLVGTSPSAVVADAVDQQQVATTCSDPSKTNVAGTCADVHVTASTLPDYHPEDVFGHDPDTLWRRVLRRQKDQMAYLATYPDDPTLN